MKKTKKTNKEAIENLRSVIECASRDSSGRPIVYTLLLSVSRSGTYRKIAAYIVDVKNEPIGLLNISGLIAEAWGGKTKEHHGNLCLGLSGFGTDMGYEIVSSVSYLLTEGKNYRSLAHRWM